MMARISFWREYLNESRNRGRSMIGEELIQFLEIGTIAVLLVLVLQSIH